MSAKECGEWIEFFHLEPFGWEAQCFTAGIVASTIANVNRDPKKKRIPFEAIDFVPGMKKSPKKTDGVELKAKLRLAYAGLAGLKNHSQKAQGNTRNAPRNREGNKRQPGRGNRGLSKNAVAGKDRPNNKRSQQDPIDE